jgi:hypothetical protein
MIFMCEISLKSMFSSYEVYLLWSYYEHIIQLLNLISMKNNLNIKKKHHSNSISTSGIV